MPHAPKRRSMDMNAKIPKGTFGRLMKYLFKHYKLHLIVVVACIIIAAVSSTVATFFLQRLIDECITPGITEGLDAVWGNLVKIVITMAVIYAVGVFASFLYTRIMATVTQGTLYNFRTDMFDKMQTLPIKYFDTHAHGDIMSTYTNDTDALRQMIGQSIPMIIQSSLTLIAIVFMMLFWSLWLSLIVALGVFVMQFMAKKFGGGSARFMMKQQKTLAKEEGFVELSLIHI